MFRRVVLEADLPEGSKHASVCEGWPLLVLRHGGKIFAIINKCSHASAELAGGRIRGGAVTCPLHGARFEIETGKCLGGAYKPLKIFEARVREGWIEVAIPADAPSFEHQPVSVR